MNKKFDKYKIITICSAVLVIICLFRIKMLKNQLDDMNFKMDYEFQHVNDNLSSTISTVNSNFETALTKENSNVLSSSYEYGTINIADKTVNVLFNVIPKEYSSDTEARLILDNIEYPLIHTGDTFNLELKMPLLNNTSNAKIKFINSETTKTEVLDWNLSPCSECLPYVVAFLDGEAGGSNKYKRNGNLSIDISYPYLESYTINIKSIDLLEILDGKEINRTNIKKDILSTNIPEHINYTIDNTYDIPNGSVHELCVDIEDQYGFHYRIQVDSWFVNEHGIAEPGPDDCWTNKYPSQSIFDADGKPIFEYNYSDDNCTND